MQDEGQEAGRGALQAAERSSGGVPDGSDDREGLRRRLAELEAELERQRARHEAVVSAVPGGLILLGADGQLRVGNDAARALGIPEAGPDAPPRWSAVREDGTPCPVDELPMHRAARGERIPGEVYGVQPQEGEVRWLLMGAAPLREPGAEGLGAAAVVIDVSDRIEAARALERSERELRASQRVAGLGSWRLDPVADELHWSDETFAIFGLEPTGGPVPIDLFYRLVHPDDRDAVRAAADTATEETRPYAIRHRIVRPDGEVRVVQGRAEPYPAAEGRPSGLVGTVQDVTEEVEREEQLQRAQRMEVVGRLAGGMAHDLNNLLTVLTGHAELIAEVTEQPEVGESAEAVLRSAGRAATLTRQLLAFARREHLHESAVDLATLLGEQARLYRRVVPDGVRVDVAWGEGLPAVRADAARLEQVLLNLVLNARDAVGASGRIAVAARTRDVGADDRAAVAPGSYVEVTVTDDGHGMGPETLERAFDPFYSTKDPEVGTGLGLSTAFGIVAQSGGDLTLDSAPGRGTTARLLLPVAPAAEPAEAGAGDRAPRGGDGETVLLAEDEPTLRDLCTHVLRRHGYAVIPAADGDEALAQAVEAGDVHVLITDVSMPGVGGAELAASLRARRGDLPVLYLSGYTEDSAVLDGLDGQAAFLAKPFTTAELLGAVRRVLGGP